VAPSKKSRAGMIKTAYRSKFTIGMAWLCAPLLLGTALSYVVLPGPPGWDAIAVLAAGSSGFVGLLYVWILVKRRVPVVAISDQTLELAPPFPFQKLRSVPIDEINGIALKGRRLVVESRAGTVTYLLLDLDVNEVRPILAAIQRRIEERKAIGRGK
jgi:hypothetical protein